MSRLKSNLYFFIAWLAAWLLAFPFLEVKFSSYLPAVLVAVSVITLMHDFGMKEK